MEGNFIGTIKYLIQKDRTWQIPFVLLLINTNQHLQYILRLKTKLEADPSSSLPFRWGN